MAQASNELEARLEASGAATTFFKGCSWSPDGLCLLTATDSSQILLFNSPARCLHAESATEAAQGGATASLDAAVPRAEGDAGMDVCGETPPGPAEDLTPVLSVQEGEMVYDYCWYPRMNSYEPSSCCFLSTTRDHPLHLWDAYTGRLRCKFSTRFRVPIRIMIPFKWTLTGTPWKQARTGRTTTSMRYLLPIPWHFLRTGHSCLRDSKTVSEFSTLVARAVQ